VSRRRGWDRRRDGPMHNDGDQKLASLLDHQRPSVTRGSPGASAWPSQGIIPPGLRRGLFLIGRLREYVGGNAPSRPSLLIYRCIQLPCSGPGKR